MLASAAITPDARWIACGTHDGKVRIWDRTTDKEHGALTGMKENVHLLAFSPDGKTLAAASEWAFSGEQVRPVVLWDWVAGQELRRLQGHTAAILTLVFTPDGKHLLTGGRDLTGRVWGVATGEEVARVSRDRWGYVNCLTVSADGKTIYVADGGLRPRFVDFPSRKEIALEPPVASHPSPLPFPIAGELPSSKWADHECRLPGGQVMRTVTGDLDWGVRLVDLSSGKTVRHFAKGWVVVFDCTPDSKMLATYGHPARDGGHRATAVQLWDIATGKQIGTVGSNDPRPDYALRFSPYGKLLAIRHHGGTVGLWDVGTGKEVLRLDADGWWPGPFTFSKDGRSLVSGSKDSPLLLVWDISTDGK
jgi:WD40 repeat protein